MEKNALSLTPSDQNGIFSLFSLSHKLILHFSTLNNDEGEQSLKGRERS